MTNLQQDIKIHTIFYNSDKSNHIDLTKFTSLYINAKIVFWNYEKILNLLQTSYPDYVIYFKRLILNKSRENFAKYIIIKEFGGIFINLCLLEYFGQIDVYALKSLLNKDYDMMFWSEQTNSNILAHDIYKTHFDYLNKNFVCDDIFIIKNKSNSFINYLLEKINLSIIPTNSYQNSINLGNIFLTSHLEEFYESKIGINIHNVFSNWFGSLEKKYLPNGPNQFEKSIYSLKFLNLNIQPIIINYAKWQEVNEQIYPNIPELAKPEHNLILWEKLWKLQKSIVGVILMVAFKKSGWISGLVWTIVLAVCEWIVIEYIKSRLNITIKPAFPDNKVLFNPKKYKFTSKLKRNWKIIRDEALNALNSAPILPISRDSDDWYGATKYFNDIKDKYGWIKSWGSKNNSDWLNYGLIYFGDEFSVNTKNCPNTMKILKEFESEINICGFSWMRGGCVIKPHTDITGLTSNSLELHMGLVIPKPKQTCKLVITNLDGEYVGMEEEEGKVFVFDATYEHYAYNQSNQDRIILYIDFKMYSH